MCDLVVLFVTAARSPVLCFLAIVTLFVGVGCLLSFFFGCFICVCGSVLGIGELRYSMLSLRELLKNFAGVDDVAGQSKCVASTSDSVEASGWLEGLLILI